MRTHKVRKLNANASEYGAGEYEYRGYKIHRHDDVCGGYWGRWSVGNRAHTDDSMASCIRWIDARIEARETGESGTLTE